MSEQNHSSDLPSEHGQARRPNVSVNFCRAQAGPGTVDVTL